VSEAERAWARSHLLRKRKARSLHIRTRLFEAYKGIAEQVCREPVARYPGIDADDLLQEMYYWLVDTLDALLQSEIPEDFNLEAWIAVVLRRRLVSKVKRRFAPMTRLDIRKKKLDRARRSLEQRLKRPADEDDVYDAAGLPYRVMDPRYRVQLEESKPERDPVRDRAITVKVEAVVRSLGAVYRPLMHLRYEQNLGMDQIARRLQMSKPEVKKRLGRLDRALQSALSDLR
jgi:RNA polymerase sigma factor (sigma-70 family)